LNAYLLYRFVAHYIKGTEKQGIPLQLAYIPIPILLDEDYYSILVSTYKSWYKFLSKFPNNNKTTASISDSITVNYLLSQKAIAMAIKMQLLTINRLTGEIIPLSSKHITKTKLNKDIKKLSKQAEKLAKWSKDYSIAEIFSILGVEL
jgi:hypothetical protein